MSLRLATAEVVRGHVAIGVCLFVLGYVAQGALQQVLPTSAGVAGPMHTSASVGDLAYILRNNLLFFAAVSLLPIVNSVVVGQQLFVLGATAQLIDALPLGTQVELLYRHSAFEIVALTTAVRISYIAYFAIREFLNSASTDKAELKSRLKSTIPLYGLLVAAAVVGALLEGAAHVNV